MNTAPNPNNYPTYNIGDKVTIRQWDDMESEFGLNRYGAIKTPQALFTEPMKQYCGQTLPIVRIDPFLHPSFDFYYLGGSTAVFTFPMFEQSCPTVVCASTLSFDDLLKGATSQLANPQA
jgi:hypothetical protein